MKKLLFTISLVLMFSLTAFGEINFLEWGGKPNDDTDDSADLQLVINDIMATTGGGTIYLPAGVWDFRDPITFVQTTIVNNSITIRGDKGTVIIPALSNSETLFGGGNQNQLSFENLTFIGEATGNDVGRFLYADNVGQLRFSNCQFYGLKSFGNFIDGNNVDLIIENSMFAGMASTPATINLTNFRGLTVRDTEFLDYGHFNGRFYSKSFFGSNAWIKVSASSVVTNATGQRAVILQNVRFDEGAYHHVEASSVRYLSAQGIQANVATVTGGTGFYLDNVKYADIKMSNFGLANVARPAVTALNNSNVQMDGVTVADSVFYGVRDTSSQVFFNTNICTSGCSFSVL